MTDRLNQLKKQLTDWLRRNELDSDLSFWSQTQWRQRGEDYLDDAEFVITTEGSLCFLLNYAFGDPKVDEFQDLLLSFGFWFEMGHSWSIGIYADDDYDGSPTPNAYSAKLRDARWKTKADSVRQKSGHQCQDCGSTDRPLEVHHCWYRYALEPWQYPFDALRCLCRNCHKQRATADHDFRCLIGEFTWQELASIRGSIKRLFYWYERSAALAFLDAIGPNDATMSVSVENLSMQKTEPGAT